MAQRHCLKCPDFSRCVQSRLSSLGGSCKSETDRRCCTEQDSRCQLGARELFPRSKRQIWMYVHTYLGNIFPLLASRSAVLVSLPPTIGCIGPQPCMKFETSIKSEGARLNNSNLEQLMSPSSSKVQYHHQQNEQTLPALHSERKRDLEPGFAWLHLVSAKCRLCHSLAGVGDSLRIAARLEVGKE
ncbi:hypothetical protein N656DRAFT_289748 [Canariomyces notabilis]|uniref:Uncharacterized protein n=1 Tax=Canariomyces notabilis TaxID=2074819 RepID=A0AAN6TAH1_9PEZI|nr:hypothetical protein N656DRAFT_289748 [Canariomyces arenarius]